MKTKMRIAAVLGLVFLAGLVMGLKYFGYEKVAALTPATAAAETITAADGQSFTFPFFPGGARFVVVCVSLNCPANIWLKVNATTCNPTASGFDTILQPGQTWTGFAGTALSIEEVTLYADAGCTVGTDVTVNGVN